MAGSFPARDAAARQPGGYHGGKGALRIDSPRSERTVGNSRITETQADEFLLKVVLHCAIPRRPGFFAGAKHPPGAPDLLFRIPKQRSELWQFRPQKQKNSIKISTKTCVHFTLCSYGHNGSMAYKTFTSLPGEYGLAPTMLGGARSQIQLADDTKRFRDYSIGVELGDRCEGTVSIQSPADAYGVPHSKMSVTNSVGGSIFFWRAKRVVDILVSLLLLPALGFVCFALLILNRRFNRGPLFYHQKRMGQELMPFTAIKFRTMQPVEEITRSANDPIEVHRITPLGMILRKTRIDELPQIFNVLRGEMSLIGPRPDYFDHAREYLAQIPEYRDRHLVRPGISGLAQVTLGYASGIDATRAKANADLAYIRNASFGLELKVFWLTLVTVFMRRGT